MVGNSKDRVFWLSRHILPHEPALRAWLYRRRVPDLDIDDIVQESYAKLAALESVDNIRNPKNYLFQIAYSVIVTHIRRSRVVSIFTPNVADSADVMEDMPSPERALEDRDELQKLAEAIVALPITARTVLLLRRVEGLSQRDVAQRLGLSENSVEHHMANGIHFLMDHFGRGGKPRRSSSKKGEKREISVAYDRAGNKSRD